jgi:hypothetical protein
MYAYADQNFIIRCRDTPEWRDAVIRAHRSGKATLVLSPLHFYEIGTVREELCEGTIQLVEAVQPAWVLTRFDLLVEEFLFGWNQFWKRPCARFSPIGDLAHVLSAMHRRPREDFEGYAPRDFIGGYRDPSSLQGLRESFARNRAANDHNRPKYKSGEITPEFLRGLERTYVAIQLSRITGGDPHDAGLNEKAELLLQSEPSFSRISIFIENGGTRRLKAYSVERLMTADAWSGNAAMKENRQVDRDHAVIALSYCDIFVTDDGELRKRCEQVRANCSFPLAEVVTIEDWIGRVQKM